MAASGYEYDSVLVGIRVPSGCRLRATGLWEPYDTGPR